MSDSFSIHTRRSAMRVTAGIVAGLYLATMPVNGLMAATSAAIPINVSPVVPHELNPLLGGAPAATPDQAVAFAWQEFIALSWPAGPQTGQPGQREAPSKTAKFGDASFTGPLVWQTFRGKVETFPGNGIPPGFPGPVGDKSLGYDALPQYNYSNTIPACNTSQQNDATPWVNLDETSQIGLDNMFAGVVTPTTPPSGTIGNSVPQLIRFLAKSNRSQYVYVASNSSGVNLWWQNIPTNVTNATQTYLAANNASPSPGNPNMVSNPNGTIELKAGWRQLNPAEASSGRFHQQSVRFYETVGGNACYVDATWGLVALHIIQKTPSAPYFIYATFEQADNLLTASGAPVEDVNGNIIVPPPAQTTKPPVCLIDPVPNPPGSTLPPAPPLSTSTSGAVVAVTPANCPLTVPTTTPPVSYCTTPGSQLYYQNSPNGSVPANGAPTGGNICVNVRDQAIPPYVIASNFAAHKAISTYLQKAGLSSSPWLFYKLVNVQYYPYDKIPNASVPNGSPYTGGKPPYTAKNPAPSSYYQANIVVETNRTLQMFTGGLSGGGGVSAAYRSDGTLLKNTFYGGHGFNMGGCMGCHGAAGQLTSPYGDFSVILRKGSVSAPDAPVDAPQLKAKF